MAAIHKLSHGTPLPEFDSFTLPPTQISVERDIETEHRPNLPLREDTKELIFEFATPVNEYVNFREKEIYFRLRFKTASKNWTFTPEMYFLDSMIESVDVWINDKLITHSTSTYPWRAQLNRFFNYSTNALSSHVTSSMCDMKGKLWHEGSTGVYGPWFELRDKIFTDLALQNRAILGGCKFKIIVKLTRREFLFRYDLELNSNLDQAQGHETSNIISDSASSAAESLHPKHTVAFDVDYELAEAAILVHRACVSLPTLEAHRKALALAPAFYPINRVEIKTISVPPNMNDVRTESIFTGQLPRRVIVFFVLSDAVLGQLNLSPYKFQDFDINYIAFDIDGVKYPRNGYTPDFENRRCMREYYGLLQSLNQDNADSVIQLSYLRYLSQVPMFAYNFAPDLSGGCDFGHVNIIKRGSFGLHLRFAKPQRKTITAFIHAEFDNLITINREGFVSTDYI